mmetsp:Transcript_55531/g.153123  ORF Transcript_55531/g.153123 Transcript_55531/m.153123 type:complete len:455 (+) Transcript_55531:544-1908(+)
MGRSASAPAPVNTTDAIGGVGADAFGLGLGGDEFVPTSSLAGAMMGSSLGGGEFRSGLEPAGPGTSGVDHGAADSNLIGERSGDSTAAIGDGGAGSAGFGSGPPGGFGHFGGGAIGAPGGALGGAGAASGGFGAFGVAGIGGGGGLDMDLNMDLNARFGDASFGIGGGIASGIGGGGLGLREAPGQGSAFSMDLDSSLFGGGLGGSLYGGGDSQSKSKPRTTSRFFSSEDDPELVPGTAQGTATGAAAAPGSAGFIEGVSSAENGNAGTAEAAPGPGTAVVEGHAEAVADGSGPAATQDETVVALRRESAELRDALNAAKRATEVAEAKATAAGADAAAAKEEAEGLRRRCEELEKRAGSSQPHSSGEAEAEAETEAEGNVQGEGGKDGRNTVGQLEAELAEARGKLEAETARADKVRATSHMPPRHHHRADPSSLTSLTPRLLLRRTRTCYRH